MSGAPASEAKGRPWAFCLVSVLALHGAALAWMVHGEESQGPALVKAGQSVSARLVSVGPVTPASPQNSLSATESKAQASALDAQNVATSSATGGATAVDPQPAASPDGDSAIDLDGYVPRRWLTVAPRPTAPVLLPFPSAFQDTARYKAVLNLFIEADGRVGRVEFVGIALPEVLERAARNTFEHARFTPGQVKGRIVKSLIQIEVDFDGLGAS